MKKSNETIYYNKVFRRLWVIITAGFMLASAVPVLAESNDIKDTMPMISQGDLLDVSTFTEELRKTTQYLSDKLPTQLDKGSISRINYITNIAFIEDSTPFVELDYVYGNVNGHYIQQNISVADNALGFIQDYNQSVLERLYDLYRLQGYVFDKCDKQLLRPYLEKVVESDDYSFEIAIYDYNCANPRMSVDVIHDYGCVYSNDFLKECLANALKNENFDIEVFIEKFIEKLKSDIRGKLIYPSIFCHSDRDKEILDREFEKLFQMVLYYNISGFLYYNTSGGPVRDIHDIPGYNTICEQFISSESVDEASNNDISVGARYLLQRTIGDGIKCFQQQFMLDISDYDELEKYFYREYLDNYIWYRAGIITDPNGTLEIIVYENQQIDEVGLQNAITKLLDALFSK